MHSMNTTVVVWVVSTNFMSIESSISSTASLGRPGEVYKGGIVTIIFAFIVLKLESLSFFFFVAVVNSWT